MIRLSQEEEKELRDQLENIKAYRDFVDVVRKYATQMYFIVEGLPVELIEVMNKTKMALVREIGQRRKNMDLLGIKPRFPGDR